MSRQRGFHYVEVVVAVLLLTIAIAPALDALLSGLQGAAIPAIRMANRYWLGAKLEEVLSQGIGTLDAAATSAGNRTTPTSYSDANGSVDRRLVYLSRYDGDNADGDNNGFTGIDAGLIWVRVELENTNLALESLITND